MALTADQIREAEIVINKLDQLAPPSFLELNMLTREKEQARKSIKAEIALALLGKKVKMILNEYAGSEDCIDQEEQNAVLEDCLAEAEKLLRSFNAFPAQDDNKMASKPS